MPRVSTTRTIASWCSGPSIVADYGLPVLLPATWDAACRRAHEDPPPDIARFAQALEQLKQAELPGDPVQTGIIAALERYNQTQRAAPSGGGTPAGLRGMADLASRLANPTDPGMARTWATILAAEYLDQAACAVVMPLTWAAMCDLFLGKRDPHDIVTPGLVRQAWKRGRIPIHSTPAFGSTGSCGPCACETIARFRRVADYRRWRPIIG
ncbi:MAG: hypothetical protein U0841_29320 [Chloroflexia bacterium]